MSLLSNNINIPSIIAINLMGLVVLFTIFIGSDWRIVRRTTTVKALLLMAISVAIGCILEPICYMQDSTSRIGSYILNSLLHYVHCITPIGWIMMISTHLNVKISRIHKIFLIVYLLVFVIVLVVNLFVPILFYIDDKGTYTRSAGYIIFLVVGLSVVFDGVIISFKTRHRSDRIKFFPVWAFLIPALLGRAIQTVWYGLSTAVPFLAVSIGCCALCLQNERLYRDTHTHLYNRTYLKSLEQRLKKQSSHIFTAIFLDVNKFKSINDTYGHLEGDRALIRVAEALRDSVADKGEVIRYAGDEFFILYNSSIDDAKKLVDSINEQLSKLQIDTGKLYSLSVSAGIASLDLKNESIDDVLDRTDKLMYENKRGNYSRGIEE